MSGRAVPAASAHAGRSSSLALRSWRRLAIALAMASAAVPALAADGSPWAYGGVLDFKLPILLALIIFTMLIVLMIGIAKKNPNLYIRPLGGITAIEEAIGRATEMGRPVIYIPGVDDINNIQTIYSMVILEKVAT